MEGKLQRSASITRTMKRRMRKVLDAVGGEDRLWTSFSGAQSWGGR